MAPSNLEENFENKMMERVSVVWFRNGLRLHDNAPLHKAIEAEGTKVLPIFIFDGETPTTKKCGYNKVQFLLECLNDIDQQLRTVDSRLYCVPGKPEDVFRNISKKYKIEKICFDQDAEPIWLERDNAVKNFCASHKIEVEETIGATLWDPLEIIEANGGTPPLTYTHFCHVTTGLGDPARPYEDVDLSTVNFLEIDEDVMLELKFYPCVPTPETLGFVKNGECKVYGGGELKALKFFNQRVQFEKEAFLDGSFLPNRRDPDILKPPKSLSPDLKFGCISVKKFYWAIVDAFVQVHEGNPAPSYTIVSQLIWREFFYAMSANNPYYGEIERNPICINVPWYEDNKRLDIFLSGQTGYPFIDAGIRQIKLEGWAHHVVRNAVSMFLTRGDLWLSWIHGLDFFLTNLIDADWAVCAGNWMWVSSSAFEKALNCSFSLDPRRYGRRIDPYGEYIKRYVPELKNFPTEYIYTPWEAPDNVQEEAGCIIGKDYPAPVVDHDVAVQRNRQMMEDLQVDIMTKLKHVPLHIKPSDSDEIKNFFRQN
eukprot:TRINITY_DN925_c0_g1_i7.p1 TRINITY_DN925_c0_g1~~TRINITY_DN925_c0_g1_i7.p1  ORF type:complete len:539 (+),score=169.43 TRINITY_DN925_c0_g1_i7:322-1938(+)